MINSSTSGLLSAIQTHYAELTAFLARKFGCPLLAAEVAQETWLRISRMQGAEPIEHPRAYLFKMASHVAIDHLRQQKAQARHICDDPIPDDLPSQLPGPETILDYQQRLAILQQAIAELPPRCRQVFSLHKFEGQSHAAIAAQLGISRNMVEKHVIKALAHCRKRLDCALR